MTTKNRYKFVGVPDEIGEWLTDKLGLEPTRVSHVRIDIGTDCAATITVDMFALSGDVSSLPLGELESEEDA